MKTILFVALLLSASFAIHSTTPASGPVLELTDDNFQAKVLSSNKLTVVDFWATWCGPCRAVGPVIETVAKEYKGKINVGKVNVDYNPGLTAKYNVSSIPTVFFIKGGKVVDKLVGAYPKSAYVKKIEKYK
jgi:thioredoxin 1